MDLQLTNKVIIVTGGAKGIGGGIANVLAEEGANVIVVGRNEKDNDKKVTEILLKGGDATQIVAELTHPEACKYVIDTALAQYNRIDGIVNNAGYNDGVSLEHGTYERFVQSLHKSVIHYYMLAHYALPALIKSKGSIVNISSKTGETGQGNTSGYAASNGARNALTREWAVELLKYGIRVNAVVVAECWTPQYETWVGTLTNANEKLKEITARIPLGNRMTTVEEIANTTAFLLSAKSSHTTGQLIHVDGGYVHLDRALANA
jgi:L-fucose dehydrogenase